LEIIACSGLRWHNAANKAMVAAVLCSYIIQNNIIQNDIIQNVGAAPYSRTMDPRAKLDAHFAKAFNEFNKQDDLRFNQYVAQAPGLVHPVSADPAGRRRRRRRRHRGRSGGRGGGWGGG
jgi:hypothetical protein